MGSISSFMSMVPGMGNMLSQGSDKENIQRVKDSLCILGNFFNLR